MSWKIITETIDELITFIAHFFYRRDFQVMAAFTSKVSQLVLSILLKISSFPIKWTNLRNYKLVIDRWGENVPEDS
jgi:hypothetical protein